MLLKKKNCVFVFSFMYLVSVDPMDRSQVTHKSKKGKSGPFWQHQSRTKRTA